MNYDDKDTPSPEELKPVHYIEEDVYPKFHSIPRRYRDITITEKIDGTNGLIRIFHDGVRWQVFAGSRNHWLNAEDKTKDNFGFALWVADNKKTLIDDLGEGDHYGEWWGSGIQRSYGLINGRKIFSLFNTNRWNGETELNFTTPFLSVVPVIKENVINNDVNIQEALNILKMFGSYANSGFMDPEGIVIWDHQAKIYQKITLNDDGISKQEAARRLKNG